MPEHDEVLGRWSRTAPFWDQHREILRELFGPVSEALIKEAEVVPGCAVLDVATGSGEPALRVAEVVGPAGTVAGVDPAAGMIEAARRVAALAIHEPQIDRCTPLAVALPLVNAALAVSTSLCHDSPPCRLLSMRFGTLLSLRTLFDPYTVVV